MYVKTATLKAVSTRKLSNIAIGQKGLAHTMSENLDSPLLTFCLLIGLHLFFQVCGTSERIGLKALSMIVQPHSCLLFAESHDMLSIVLVCFGLVFGAHGALTHIQPKTVKTHVQTDINGQEGRLLFYAELFKRPQRIPKVQTVTSLLADF